MEDKPKQVIVVRTKYPDGKGGTKGLRAGKLIAQACHASSMFILDLLQQDSISSADFSEPAWEWLTRGRMAKITCQVATEEELQALHEAAQAADLLSYLITDHGLTEFDGVPTVTALAIGPDWASRIDPVTGNLKLY